MKATSTSEMRRDLAFSCKDPSAQDSDRDHGRGCRCEECSCGTPHSARGRAGETSERRPILTAEFRSIFCFGIHPSGFSGQMSEEGCEECFRFKRSPLEVLSMKKPPGLLLECLPLNLSQKISSGDLLQVCRRPIDSVAPFTMKLTAPPCFWGYSCFSD